MTDTTEPVRPRRKRRMIWGAILIVLIIVLWLGYWFAARQAATMAFDRAFTSLAAAERDVACDESAMSGFPFRLALDCGKLAFTDRKAGATVTAARVTASAPLYRPGRVEAVIASPMTIDGARRSHFAPSLLGRRRRHRRCRPRWPQWRDACAQGG